MAFAIPSTGEELRREQTKNSNQPQTPPVMLNIGVKRVARPTHYRLGDVSTLTLTTLPPDKGAAQPRFIALDSVKPAVG